MIKAHVARGAGFGLARFFHGERMSRVAGVARRHAVNLPSRAHRFDLVFGF
jgi:hypothetical protein